MEDQGLWIARCRLRAGFVLVCSIWDGFANAEGTRVSISSKIYPEGIAPVFIVFWSTCLLGQTLRAVEEQHGTLP